MVPHGDFPTGGRQRADSTLGPLNKENTVVPTTITQCQAIDLIGSLDSVKIKMVDAACCRKVLLDQRVSRTDDRSFTPQRVHDSLDEGRLSRPEIALQVDHLRGLQRPGEGLTQRPHFLAV